MSSQASAAVKPTTKSLSPLLPTQVRHVLPGRFMCTKQIMLAVYAMQYKHNVATLLHLAIKAFNYVLDTNALNISRGKKKHCLYSMCVFMLHVRIHPIPQRGNLCLRCRHRQCLLCLWARLLWRWDCPSSSSTAPTSAPVATPPPCPPAPASSLYSTPQPSPVGLNGWVTTTTRVNFSWLLQNKGHLCTKNKAT